MNRSPHASVDPAPEPTTRRRSGFVPRPADPLAAGDASLSTGALDHACAHYERVLADEGGDADRTAAALYGLGAVARARGDFDGAVRCLEQVIALSPDHRPAFHDLLQLCAASGRWDKVLEVEQRLFDAIDDPRERCDELIASGDRWWQGASDRERALARYRQVLCIDRRHRGARARVKVLKAAPRRTRRDDLPFAATPVCRVVPLGVMIDERILADLDRVAERQRLSRSSVVMHAILAYLEQAKSG